MSFKFYYSYKEFIKDFHQYFKEWNITFQEADVNDYKSLYLKEYKHFYNEQEDSIVYNLKNINTPLRFKSNIPEINFLSRLNGYLDESNEEIESYWKTDNSLLSIMRNRLFFKNEGSKDYTFKKLYPLLVKTDEGVIFDENKYQNFKYSVKKIVLFLKSKKDNGPDIEINKNDNTKILNEYYNSIVNVRVFKSLVINRESDCYYSNAVKEWEEYRNKKLDKNDILNLKSGWLRPFNSRLSVLMTKIVILLKEVIKFKEEEITTLHPNNIEVAISVKLQPLKGMVNGLKLNLDTNKILAYEMQQYILNGFDLMFIYLKDELLIDVKKIPCFHLIQEVINDIDNSIDFEKIKISLENEKYFKQPFKQVESITDNFTFINNFDSIESDKVFNYFYDSLVVKKYLDIDSLKKFLITVFQDESVLSPRLSFSNNNAVKIRSIFYKYYKEVAGKRHGKQKDYVRLLGENFQGYQTTALITNFSK